VLLSESQRILEIPTVVFLFTKLMSKYKMVCWVLNRSFGRAWAVYLL